MRETPAGEAAVRLEAVWKIFGARAGEAMDAMRDLGLDKAEVLRRFDCTVGVADVTLEVRRGETFCVMGLSGCGKSTLVRHLNRLVAPAAGAVQVLGQDILALDEGALRDFRARRLGMVFQHMALLPHRSVRDNVAFPLEVQGLTKIKRWEISARALALVQLEGFEDHLPGQLSGGMQQRVGLARALASEPELLLLDEPFSALDPLIRRQLQGLFLSLSGQLATTTVFITHDLDEAIRMGDRIAIMKDGRIVQVGTPKEIVTRPADAYVADFVKDVSRLRLLDARAIMQPLAPPSGPAPGGLARAAADSSLECLIDLAVDSGGPIVVTGEGGREIGMIDEHTLLAAVQGRD